MKLRIIIFVFVSFSAYTQNQEILQDLMIDPYTINPEFDLNFSPGNSLAEIKDYYGEPLQIDAYEVVNRYNENVVDSIYVLVYMCHEISIYVSSISDSAFINSISIYESNYALIHRINFGMSIEELIDILGNPLREPRTRDGQTFISYNYDPLDKSIFFVFEQNALIKIYYVSTL